VEDDEDLDEQTTESMGVELKFDVDPADLHLLVSSLRAG
jgi:hypothetical protein